MEVTFPGRLTLVCVCVCAHMFITSVVCILCVNVCVWECLCVCVLVCVTDLNSWQRGVAGAHCLFKL